MDNYIYIVKYREGLNGLVVSDHAFSTLEKAAEYCDELYKDCQKSIKRVKASGVNVKETTAVKSQYFKATASDGKMWLIEVIEEIIDRKIGMFCTQAEIKEALGEITPKTKVEKEKLVPAKWPGLEED